MYKKITQYIFSYFFITFALLSSVNSVFAKAAFNQSLDEAAAGTGHKTNIGNDAIYNTIANVIKLLLSVIGVIFIILIIYAGITWMMARGDESEATKAKDIIKRAIIGLFIILSAYSITAFVGSNISN